MTNTEFAKEAKSITELKTLYVLGAFGAPAMKKNKTRYGKQSKNACRKAEIEAASDDTFFFDCIGMIKAILWGFSGDKTKTYGGAKYTANGVPDKGANSMFKLCADVSTDFSKIEVGEVVWLDGHIGVYIGDGKVAECTSAWESRAMITACGNIGKITGLRTRTWTKHGRLPYVEYAKPADPLKVGDGIRFTGEKQYTNSGALLGKKAKPCKATIKQIYKLGKSKHPYLIKGSGVYGWVNEDTIERI